MKWYEDLLSKINEAGDSYGSECLYWFQGEDFKSGAKFLLPLILQLVDQRDFHSECRTKDFGYNPAADADNEHLIEIIKELKR